MTTFYNIPLTHISVLIQFANLDCKYMLTRQKLKLQDTVGAHNIQRKQIIFKKPHQYVQIVKAFGYVHLCFHLLRLT